MEDGRRITRGGLGVAGIVLGRRKVQAAGRDVNQFSVTESDGETPWMPPPGSLDELLCTLPTSALHNWVQREKLSREVSRSACHKGNQAG